MQKLKFGIQLTALMLAFPLWFMAEMKLADRDMKKNQPEKQESVEIKKEEAGKTASKASPVSDISLLPGSAMINVTI
ncbi:MAG TPA: hypothetical protein PLZ45_12895 [Ferruginibacter sp.]|nr:hypothetical protein [Ferruginibacter sp.]